MRALVHGDKAEFVNEEIKAREILKMPPFGRLAALVLSAKDRHMLGRVCQELARRKPDMESVAIYGPADAPLSFLRGRYRKRFLVHTPKNVNIQQVMKIWLGGFTFPSTVQVKVDIDPYSFL